jgi:hypothetical protein
MEEFKHKGGVLSGREERYDEFEGVPKNIGGGTTGGFGHVRDATHHDAHSTGSEHHKHGDFNNTPNHHSAGLAGSGTAGSGLTGSHNRESNLSNTTGNTGRHVGTDGPIGSSAVGSSGHRDGTDLPKALTEDKSRANMSSGHHDTTGTSSHKPGLMDKLNPKVDADGDGKAGFMK